MKLPAAKKVYSNSSKAAHSTTAPVLLGGTLVLSPQTATTNPKACTNPTARTVHPNPTRGSNSLAMAGKIRPPVADPHAEMPIASPRREEK